MDSNLQIVSILTIGFAMASFLAYLMRCLQLPTILGYLLAGYLIGPYSPGFVADAKIAEQLAEIGVILMLFVVGLHFKIEDLIRVRKVAIPGAIIQTLVATLFTTLIVYSLGWSIKAGIIIGLSIGVASTVVLVRVLADNNVLNTVKGHIAVGWLVVEDIFTVIILILLPTLAAVSTAANFSMLSVLGSIVFVIAKFCLLALFMFTWGHRVIDYILTNIARIRSQELFTLTIIAVVFLIATGSAVIFGTSIALGAFIAGMVIGKTNLRHQAAANALPIKDIFAVIFFLSVGMLFDPIAIASHFALFLGIIFVVLIIKPLVAYLITVSLGYSLNVALTVAISLAQIGEFSFILAEVAMNLKIIPDEAFDILVACAIISISLNPLLFQMIESIEAMLQKIPFFRESKKYNFSNLLKENKKTSLVQERIIPSTKVLVIGFGPIGKAVSKIASEAGFVPIIVEQNIDTVSSIEEHYTVLFGDAADESILKDAYLDEASHLLITIPDTKKAVLIIHAARQSNPDIKIVARLEFMSEKYLLKELNVDYICTESEALKSFTKLAREVLI